MSEEFQERVARAGREQIEIIMQVINQAEPHDDPITSLALATMADYLKEMQRIISSNHREIIPGYQVLDAQIESLELCLKRSQILRNKAIAQHSTANKNLH